MWRLPVQWKKSILDEVLQAEGLMHLLMKPRNGTPWTAAEKQALIRHLKTLARIIPPLVIFSLPGGLLLLPLLAFYLDRRKKRGQPGPFAQPMAIERRESEKT